MNFRQEPFLSFRKVLGFLPTNIELYKLSVRHRSMPLQTNDGSWINNERLEFLGDAVLNAAIADLLYRKYPNENEGFMTNMRSNIVRRCSMNKICRKIGLDKLIIADGQVFNIENSNIYGNTLEALIGAVYLDKGYKKCMRFIKKRLLISGEWVQSLAENNENYKSELLEWCQRHCYSLDFELLEDSVDNKNKHIFVSQVLIEKMPVCTGTGTNKKESHQQASHRALRMIKNKELSVN